MKKTIVIILSSWICSLGISAQTVLTLDSCRRLAMANNKQLQTALAKQKVAEYTQRAVRTKYLPKVDALGGYEYTSREISLLNQTQKSALSGMGTNLSNHIGGNVGNVISDLVSHGIISPEIAQQLGGALQQATAAIGQAGDAIGQHVVDAFRTDTRQIWSGSVMVRQPVYMGGAITAANKMADIALEMADNDLELRRQTTVYDIEQAYWLAVSLHEKYVLAQSYDTLVGKLNSDVHKMIDEGVATRADGLKVDVRKNEADMQLTQVADGLILSKMLLCQLCGLPLDSNITLADETEGHAETLTSLSYDANSDMATADGYTTEETINTLSANRPELKLLGNAVELSRQATKLTRAEYLPHVALTGGYLLSNPNVFNGFERKFKGVWNIGVLVQVPLWNWMEGSYKVKATQAATLAAQTELSDIQEKVLLEVTQEKFRVDEARKRYGMALKNMSSAEENLRCANVGFREGVMESTDVMAAQTAWQLAHTQKIDAEIDLRLALINLKKAQGILY